jgi:hypothetical protein
LTGYTTNAAILLGGGEGKAASQQAHGPGEARYQASAPTNTFLVHD